MTGSCGRGWPEYDSFFNVGTMPKINLAYGSPAREHLLEAAKYWLDLGVDGYRLDLCLWAGITIFGLIFAGCV